MLLETRSGCRLLLCGMIFCIIVFIKLIIEIGITYRFSHMEAESHLIQYSLRVLKLM